MDTNSEISNKLFNLPPEDRNSLSDYYLLHWQGSYLIHQLLSHGPAEIVSKDKLYKLIRLDFDYDYLVKNKQDQFAISFRYPKDDTKGIGIAVARKLTH